MEWKVSLMYGSVPSRDSRLLPLFEFIDPENIDIDTIINFLFILFAEIWNIGNSCQPF